MESALFCIKISLLYDLCGSDLQAGGAMGLSVPPTESGI